MNILILNGPNLNLLGLRETSIYGSTSFEEYIIELKEKYKTLNIEYYQSNTEGIIIDKLHEVGFKYDGIVLNAGAYTHTSVAIHDAIAAIHSPVIETHISNIHKREEFRHKSLIAAQCLGSIAGFGLNSYDLAIEALILLNDKNKKMDD